MPTCIPHFYLSRLSNIHSHKSFLTHSQNTTINFYATTFVIQVRAINKNKQNNHSSARHISNLEALIAAIEATAKNVKVTAQDFAKLAFKEQVALSHSAGVFISMHGAGEFEEYIVCVIFVPTCLFPHRLKLITYIKHTSNIIYTLQFRHDTHFPCSSWQAQLLCSRGAATGSLHRLSRRTRIRQPRSDVRAALL